MCLGSTYDEFENRVNFANMTFPAGMSDIYTFEEDNPHLAINIFTHSDGQFFPVHSTNLNGETDKARVGVNLVQNTTIDMSSGELVDHFYPVTNLSKFTQKNILARLMGRPLTDTIYRVKRVHSLSNQERQNRGRIVLY